MHLTRIGNVPGMPGAAGTWGGQRRDTMLLVLADMFAVHGERQSAQERANNEELMVRLAGEAGLVVRQEVAERLARHRNPPRRLVRLLAEDEIVVAKPLLRHSPALSDEDLALIVLTTTIEHARAAAERTAFGAALGDAIVATEDQEAILTMLRNPYATMSQDGIRRLCRTASGVQDIVDALLKRDNLEPAVLADLFWYATSASREAILLRLSAHALWPAEQRRLNAPLRQADAANLKMAEEGLSKLLLGRRIDDFRNLFSRAMGIGPLLAARIMKDDGGEPFAIACRAAGFSMAAYTTLLILYNPAVGQSVQRVFALGGISETIPRALAWHLLEAWSARMGEGARAAIGLREAIHEPLAIRSERGVSGHALSRDGNRGRVPKARSFERSAGGSGG
jgi:uncharacterized protein (DUF2336 family)